MIEHGSGKIIQEYYRETYDLSPNRRSTKAIGRILGKIRRALPGKITPAQELADPISLFAEFSPRFIVCQQRPLGCCGHVAECS
jgi:hypothetical protein